jgi:hypothetical protein
MNKQLLFIILLISVNFITKAQVGFGTNTPDPSAVVDISSTNKGFLPPRIALNSTNGSDVLNPVAITAPASTNSLLVFNTVTVNDVTPGYYYYYSTTNKWVKLGDNTWSLPGNSGTIPSLNFIGTTDNKDFVIKRNSVANNSPAGLLNFAQRNTSYGISALSNSLNYAIIGTDNVATGVSTLATNQSGSFNVASGVDAMLFNNSGSYNIAFGEKILWNNSSGNHNIGFGSGVLLNNEIGNGNIGINLFALTSNQSGNYNIGIGRSALQANITGSYNIAFGVNSLYQNISGKDNIALGYQALLSNRSDNNIAIGNAALTGNNAGLNNYDTKNNTAIGYQSMMANTTNDRNNNAAIGYNSLNRLIAGSRNTAIGYASGETLLNVNNNSLLGYSADFIDKLTDNRLNIANTIFGIGLIGSVSTPVGKVGIKTFEPNSTLHIQGSLSTKITSLSIGTVADDDYTILVEGNISLPPASINNKGRIYMLVINTNISNNSSYVITGNFKDNATILTNYTLSNAGTRSITVQSNGTQWQIISAY